jgi:uncharacterized protein (UPF0276 family)
MTPSAPLTLDATSDRGTRVPHGSDGVRALRAGIGLRALHHAEIAARRPKVGWFEAHSENYFARGGSQGRVLSQVRADYELSLHGVGLSIGSTDALDVAHLAAIARLVHEHQPMLVSEHLSWGSAGGRFTNDLLPMPYTEEALRHMIERVRQVQDVLGRQILIENVSSYLQFKGAELTEWDFLAALAHESGCGLLLDVNNVYVSAVNHGFDALTYLNGIPRTAVREMHLAGHSVRRVGSRDVLIDTHDAPVCEEVWALYTVALEHFGPVPTLIEWDANIPALDVLAAEAHKADRMMEVHRARAA